MKFKLIGVLSFIAVAGFASAAFGPGSRSGGQCSEDSCTVLLSETSAISLSDQARSALFFQIDEERMARELYTAFGAKWGARPFQNIPHAEARHEAVLQALAKRAGLAETEATPGRFATAEVQRRYDALLAQGMKSATDALQAGAFVEEQDIADLRALAATTDSTELKQAVVALERASGHHLSAFVRQLGAGYKAQVLPAADVAALTGGTDCGGQGCGRGFRSDR